MISQEIFDGIWREHVTGHGPGANDAPIVIVTATLGGGRTGTPLRMGASSPSEIWIRWMVTPACRIVTYVLRIVKKGGHA